MFCSFKHNNFSLNKLNYIFFVFKKIRGNVLNPLLQVCLQDLKWVQYLVSYCLYYVLKDKTSENSAKKGTYLNAYFWHFWTLAPLLDAAGAGQHLVWPWSQGQRLKMRVFAMVYHPLKSSFIYVVNFSLFGCALSRYLMTQAFFVGTVKTGQTELMPRLIWVFFCWFSYNVSHDSYMSCLSRH